MPRKATRARIPDEGEVFGHLTTTGNYELRFNSSKMQRYSECVCDCEDKSIIWIRCNFLYNGFQSCCGCSHYKYPVAGTSFNRLTLTGNWKFVQRTHARLMQWECQCSCGSPAKYIVGSKVIKERVRSCGCLIREENLKLMDSLPYWKNAVFSQVSRSSNSKDRAFTISKDEVWSLSQKPCYYCGCAPSNLMKRSARRPAFMWHGLDRMDSSIGYIQGNVVPACWPCNRAKGNLSTSQFISNANRIAEYTKNYNNLNIIED